MSNKEFSEKLERIKSQKLECDFLDKENNELICKIEWYGGKPSINNCYICIASERNNKIAKKLFDENSVKSHPPSNPRISGCCDSALNYR